MGAEQTSVDRRIGYAEPGRAEESVDFDPNQCNCKNDCPDYPHCICILIHDEHRCICDCWGDAITLPADRAEDRRYGLDEQVNVCARAASLSRVGAALASICTADVFVPALDFDKQVALSLKDVTLGDAIREAGLVAVGGGRTV
jgi:hypothetical protein